MPPTVAIVYDLGAAGPMDIVRAARGVCDPLYLVDLDSAHCAAMLPTLERSGATCDITGLSPLAAADRVARHAPVGVTTFCEYQVGRAAEIGRALGVPAHSPDTVTALTDKLAQRAALARSGVPVPAHAAVRGTAEVGTVVAEVGLPAVVKPRRGSGSVDTFLLRHPADVAALPPLAAPMVVERMWLGDPAVAGRDWGDYVSAETVLRDGVPLHVGVTGKFPLTEPFRETGLIHPCTLAPDDLRDALDVAEAALRAVGAADGTFQVEMKLTADGPRVIEVNGRMGGFVGDVIQRSNGAWLLRAALQAAAGLPLDAGLPAVAEPPVAYTYFVLPPVAATGVVEIANPAAARRVPGVTQALVARAGGTRVSWRDGTPGMVARISGTATDHAAVRSAVDAAVDALAIRYA